jgi:hypothetical protein
MPRAFRERWDSTSHSSQCCRPKQNAPDSFESGAYVDQPSPKCCSIRRLIGRRKSVNGYFVPLSQTSPPLRLLRHFERGHGPVQFIGEIHVDRLAVFRHRHTVESVEPSRRACKPPQSGSQNPLQRNHGVARVSLHRIVSASELRIVAFAVQVCHFQPIRRALIGHGQPVVGHAV